MSWAKFMKELISMCNQATTRDYVGKLSKLKKARSTHGEYQTKFLHLSHHVHGLFARISY